MFPDNGRIAVRSYGIPGHKTERIACMKFSACWIVKNEADNIKKTLMSVKDCCKEMIVVDTGSDDDTVIIAKECGARVEHYKWTNDFSAAKNYALSLAIGDYVFFLDADEYFDPTLTKEDAVVYERAFRESGADVLILNRMEIDKDSNAFMAFTPADRVLRRATVHYEGKTHDAPKQKSGAPPKTYFIKEKRLMHTGYSNAILAEKGMRNITNLLAERSELTDPLELYINACYLLREHLFFNDFEAAYVYTRYLLDHHESMKPACETYDDGFIFVFYCAMQTAEAHPDKVNHAELREKLFGGIRECYPGTRDAALADLNYQMRFHYREDVFLRDVAEVEEQLGGLTPIMSDVCDQIEANIFIRAAEAALMRGNSEDALRWSRYAMQCLHTLEPRPLQIIFYFLRGNPPELFAAFIYGIVKMENPDMAAVVMWILNADEYRDVYNLLLERGVPPAPDDKPGIQHAVGAEEVDRIEVFHTKAAHDPDADYAASKCLSCAHMVAHARVMLGEYKSAFDIIMNQHEEDKPDYNLLRFLLVIAENGEGELAENARIRYEEGVAVLDRAL